MFSLLSYNFEVEYSNYLHLDRVVEGLWCYSVTIGVEGVFFKIILTEICSGHLKSWCQGLVVDFGWFGLLWA